MASPINQKTVAKNTLMLYIRMGIMMIVSLYTSRVVLATLGVDDFGIYNVVGGIIVMFSFMNLTLTVAIRRYLAYELGQENGGRIQEIYNASIIAVLIASVIIVLGLETLGFWFLNQKLNIPPDRIESANYVYQFSVLSFFFSMNLVPYSSAIVAFEKMGVYAYLGIAETLLKLGLVLSLPFLPGDKLKWYGALIAMLAILMAFCNFVYSTIKVIRPKSFFDFFWKDILSIFKFSAWTVLGTMVFMLATQGVNMIYNMFFGVAINAALGIAQHVANAINHFVGNFQTAFNPQLTKSYSAEGLSNKTFGFVCQTSRLSILLILVLGVPVIINIAPILELWLEDVPNYAVPFTVIFILYMAIDGASGSLYYLVYAKGDLKLYQITLGGIQIIYVALVYLLCVLGFEPSFVLSLNILTAILIYVARLVILKKLMTFPVQSFLNRVIVPLLMPIIFFIMMGFLVNHFFLERSMIWVLSKILLTIFVVSIISFYTYLHKEERQLVYSFIDSKIKKNNSLFF